MISPEFNIADYPADFAKFGNIVETLERVMRDPHGKIPSAAIVTWFIYWTACVTQNRKVCPLNIIDDKYFFYDFFLRIGFTFSHCKNITYLMERQYCRSVADIEIMGEWTGSFGIIEFGAYEFVCLRTYLRLISTSDIHRSYSHDDSYLDVAEYLKSQPSVFA